MKRMIVGIAAALISMAASAAGPPVPPETHQRDLFAGQVQLDYSKITPAGGLRAFIPTGSPSSVCLVTLGDSGTLYGTFSGPPICIPRTFEGQEGVVVLIMPQGSPLPANLTVWVSLYQQGARYYGQPVVYP